jgi:integrase
VAARQGGVGTGLQSPRPTALLPSGLIAAGCDVVTVQRALGHHSASFTLNKYAHLWPKTEDRTRNAAAAMFAAATADPVRTAEA